MIDTHAATRSNTRLFSRAPWAVASPQFAPRQGGQSPAFDDETNLSTFEASPRTHARLPRTHENGRRPQGPRSAAREGSYTPLRLTPVADPPRIPESRFRLRGTGAFENVFASGRRYDGRYLQLIAASAQQAPGRVGYVIGRKSMPRAVDRNRLRRRLRERVRAARPPLAAWDVILRIRRAVDRSEIAAAVDEASLLIARLVGDEP